MGLLQTCFSDAAKGLREPVTTTGTGEGRAAVPRASLEPERGLPGARGRTSTHASTLRAALGLLFFSFSSFCFFRATKKGMDKQSLLWGSSPRPYAYEVHALPTELKRLLLHASHTFRKASFNCAQSHFEEAMSPKPEKQAALANSMRARVG